MNVLVVGSGGREHALAWAIRKSPSAGRVYAAPGNPGTASCAENVPIDPFDFGKMADFCRAASIDLVVVGPEDPLAKGLGDYLRLQGIPVFGPGKDGARLESSKSYAKAFMAKYGIPHPRFRVFDSAEEAAQYLAESSGPWVIKADGLALGKGVTIVSDRQEGVSVINEYLSGRAHGEAGKRIVIEEYLQGQEVTAMALCDGKTVLPLPLARDHKRAWDGDRGPMTGGMGAYSPVPFADSSIVDRIENEIFGRTLEGLKREGIDFRGTIYAGLMLTSDGPRVLEYNVRFGDPETQCVLPLLEGDFARLLRACADGDLLSAGANCLQVRQEACVSVVVASGGYPGSYRKGAVIEGLDEVASRFSGQSVLVFHAGTRVEGTELVTSGGRVLAVSAIGPSLDEARELAYSAVQRIRFEGAFYRRDIGQL